MTFTGTWEEWTKLTGAERDRLRDNSALIPELVGLEGQRIEASYPDGTKARFYVGKSMGWKPVHLEILRGNSRDGCSVYWPVGTTFRLLGRHK